MRHHTSTTALATEHPGQLTPPARRALAHIRGRTITGNMRAELWRAALAELAGAGNRIERTHGSVVDDPTMTGGHVLRSRDRTIASHGTEAVR